MKKVTIFLLVVLVLGFGAPVRAQEPTETPSATPTLTPDQLAAGAELFSELIQSGKICELVFFPTYANGMVTEDEYETILEACHGFLDWLNNWGMETTPV